tara:strand:- start:202 stop:531 length:330 start_codon:yes stop_codon:yes gene_type:complete
VDLSWFGLGAIIPSITIFTLNTKTNQLNSMRSIDKNLTNCQGPIVLDKPEILFFGIIALDIPQATITPAKYDRQYYTILGKLICHKRWKNHLTKICGVIGLASHASNLI